MRTFLILALSAVFGVIAIPETPNNSNAISTSPASPGYRNDTIFSMLYTKDVIFASTRLGLFRGNPEARSWTSVHLPPGARPGGCLNATDSGASTIYYSPPVEAEIGEWADSCPVGFGLWASTDSGNSWTQMDAAHLFHGVFLHNDGLLYAAVRDPSTTSNSHVELAMFGGRPMVSADGGRLWTNTSDQDNVPGVMGFCACVKNPAHVCALGWSIRTYGMEYAPENKLWTFRSSFIQVEGETPEEYLGPVGTGSGTSPCCYMQRATLENYFVLSFGDSLQRNGISVEAAEDHYEFNEQEQKCVDVTVTLLQIDPPLPELNVPDAPAERFCWALRYIDPHGNRRFIAATAGNTPKETDTIVQKIKVGIPYRRKIDIQKLADFHEPGTYKLQLLFENSGLVKKDPNEWTGSVGGTKPFEVVISGH